MIKSSGYSVSTSSSPIHSSTYCNLDFTPLRPVVSYQPCTICSSLNMPVFMHLHMQSLPEMYPCHPSLYSPIPSLSICLENPFSFFKFRCCFLWTAFPQEVAQCLQRRWKLSGEGHKQQEMGCGDGRGGVCVCVCVNSAGHLGRAPCYTWKRIQGLLSRGQCASLGAQPGWRWPLRCRITGQTSRGVRRLTCLPWPRE